MQALHGLLRHLLSPDLPIADKHPRMAFESALDLSGVLVGECVSREIDRSLSGRRGRRP